MSNEKQISRNEAIQQVAAQLNEPVTFDEFTKRVLAIWPSKAKNPAAGIRQALRSDHIGRAVVLLDKKTVVSLRIAMQGLKFRVPLSRQEVKKGLLFVTPSLQYFLPERTPPEEAQFFDANGAPIPVRIAALKQTQKTIMKTYSYELRVFDLKKWYQTNRVKRGDSLIVTVKDWDARQFQLQHESAKERKRHRNEIEAKNQELAGILFELLESARYEDVFGREAILTAYSRLTDPTGYPGDHWLDVIKQDARMRWTGTAIRYADSFTPIERMLGGGVKRPSPAISSQQAQQVYRFKAALKHRQGLWRRIEIQGEQTLGDLNNKLRRAFEHDWDHMSGFWKLVQRGQSRRFREVHLGNLNPFGEGEAAGVTIAGLDMEVGSQLKYVHDFGDWIEHLITLESITEPLAGVKYPRVVEKNKPRYRYCVHCKEEGRKTVATWICVECSERQQVWVCEDCLTARHEDHYAEELLY